MTRHLVVLVALLFVAESHSMGFKRRKLQSGSEAGAPRELRRAEGKGAGKRSGDDAPAATAAGAGSTAPAVPAAAASAASSAAATIPVLSEAGDRDVSSPLQAGCLPKA
jgi:hypothetical protein